MHLYTVHTTGSMTLQLTLLNLLASTTPLHYSTPLTVSDSIIPQAPQSTCTGMVIMLAMLPPKHPAVQQHHCLQQATHKHLPYVHTGVQHNSQVGRSPVKMRTSRRQ